jgi:hypothetical protein
MEFAWAVQENDAVQALAEIFATIELKPLFSSLRTPLGGRHPAAVEPGRAAQNSDGSS